MSLSKGLELGVPVRLAQGLSGASTSELADIEISPTGLGLHWPRLDADLYLPALMEVDEEPLHGFVAETSARYSLLRLEISATSV